MILRRLRGTRAAARLLRFIEQRPSRLSGHGRELLDDPLVVLSPRGSSFSAFWTSFALAGSSGLLAACAPEIPSEERPARVVACSRAAQREGEPRLRWRLRWNRRIHFWESAPSRFAILAWEPGEREQRCHRDEQCAVRERCLNQRCWRSPRSLSEVRRWFRGEEALSGALGGWELRQIAPQEIELDFAGDLPAERILGVYLGASWVSARGHALGASLRPIHWIAPRQLGAADRQGQPRSSARTRYSSLIDCDTLATSTQP